MPTASRPGAAPSLALTWLALGTVYVVWGSTYLAIRVVVESAPPLLGMGTRFLTAGLLLALMIAVRRGPRALRVTRAQLVGAGAVGLLLLLGGNGGVAVAEQVVPSGIAALLIAATPLWLVLLGIGAGNRPKARSLAGTLIGFAGIAVLVRPGASLGDDIPLWGLLTLVGAAGSWAVGSFIASRVPMPRDAFVATCWEMLLGGGALLLAGAASGELDGFAVSEVEPEAWAWLAYLILVGSIVAFSAYVWLLAHAPISLTATYAYVNPVVAVLLGALVLSEPVTAAVVAGGAIVVLGVGLVVSAERPRRATVPTEPAEPPADEVIDLRA